MTEVTILDLKNLRLFSITELTLITIFISDLFGSIRVGKKLTDKRNRNCIERNVSLYNN